MLPLTARKTVFSQLTPSTCFLHDHAAKSASTTHSTHGLLKPRLILPEEFWAGLIQAAAYLVCESARINALKRSLRLTEAANDSCPCSVFNYTPDLQGWKTRAAVAGKWPAARESQKFRLNSTSSITATSLSNYSIDRWGTFRSRFRTSFATAQY